jgi:phosphatidylserine decarboxylase
MAREGVSWIVGFFVATVLFLLISRTLSLYPLRYLGWIFGLLTIMVAHFFRDPRRNSPEGEGLVVSVADGKITEIEREVWEDRYLQTKAVRIGLILSLWDVHINRAPISGRVELIEYHPGSFWPAFAQRAKRHNEHNLVGIRGPGGKVLVKQMAGLVARRIICRLRVGDTVTRGQRFGMIRLGSRVDLFLPDTVELLVARGDRILAGETIVGVIR